MALAPGMPVSLARAQCFPHFSSQILTSFLQGTSSFFFFFSFLFFLGPHERHVEVPRLGVTSELQPLAYTTATATPDLSHVCDTHHSSQQCQILNPLSEARDRTHILMDPSQVLNPLSHKGNS